MDKLRPLHLTQAFDIRESEENIDFFDANLYYDSRLFIDPFLLKRSSVSEETELFKRLAHFFKLSYEKSLTAKNNEHYIRRLKLFLTFKEPREINLGYTRNSNAGNGPGGNFANSLLSFFLESSAARLVGKEDLFPDNDFDPKFISVFADKFAEDGISDLTANLIMDYLVTYTQKQSEKYGIKKKSLPVQQSFDFEEGSWTGGFLAELPENPLRHGEPVVFVPKRLLRSHAISEKDAAIKKVVGILKSDSSFLDRFSTLIEKPIVEITIEEIRRILLTEDSVLKAFVTSLRDKDIKPYDFDKDILEFLSIKRYQHFFDGISVQQVTSCKKLLEETFKFIDLVKDDCELRDGWKDAWTENLKSPTQEEVFGRKIRGMGFAFFSKFPDVSFIPQTGTGNGFLDYAVIYKACKIAMELKKLANSAPTGDPPIPAYLQGIQRQLRCYIMALKASYGIYLTIQHYRNIRKTGRNDDKRSNKIRGAVNQIEREIKLDLKNFIKLHYINIDVTPKKPPSKT